MRSPLLAVCLLALGVLGQPSAANAAFPGASERGSAVYRYLGFPLYEARLLTKGGSAFDWNQQFGVELRYLRNLTQYDLVEGTMRELKRTGGAMNVRGKLEDCFKDVSKGDRFLAVTNGPNRLAFYLNGRQTCTLTHPQITYRFMSIFLGENTRSQRFTRNLLGQ